MVKQEREVYLQCSQCKYSETAMMKNTKLDASHRFIQIGKKVYHLKVCGEVKVIK